MGCRQCPYAKEKRPKDWVLGVGPTRKPDALLVGEAPSREDVRAREPLSGPAGREMDALLRDAGLDRERLFIINAIACVPKEPRRDREMKLAVKCCRPLLLASLAKLPIDTPTLVLGSTAQEALDLHPMSIGKNRGFIEYDWDLSKVAPLEEE